MAWFFLKGKKRDWQEGDGSSCCKKCKRMFNPCLQKSETGFITSSGYYACPQRGRLDDRNIVSFFLNRWLMYM